MERRENVEERKCRREKEWRGEIKLRRKREGR